MPQAYRILPELWLTVTGVLIMLIEPLMPPGMTRKPIGILALVGVLGALVSSIWALGLPAGNGLLRHGADRRLQRLLPRIDLQHRAGRTADRFRRLRWQQAQRGWPRITPFFFRATGMCLMSSAVELLLVFISLEISSIATYILAAIRKKKRQEP